MYVRTSDFRWVVMVRHAPANSYWWASVSQKGYVAPFEIEPESSIFDPKTFFTRYSSGSSERLWTKRRESDSQNLIIPIFSFDIIFSDCLNIWKVTSWLDQFRQASKNRKVRERQSITSVKDFSCSYNVGVIDFLDWRSLSVPSYKIGVVQTH